MVADRPGPAGSSLRRCRAAAGITRLGLGLSLALPLVRGLGRPGVAVDAPDDLLLELRDGDSLGDLVAFSHREGGHRVVLVVEGHVKDAVLGLGAVHLLDALLDDRRHLVGEGRVVGMHGRHDRRQQVRLAVLVLEALSAHRRAPRRAAHQEAPCPRVSRLPDQVPDPLEAEHRVEEVDGQHRRRPRRVGRPRRLEARHRPGLGDAFLEDLARAVLGVGEQQAGVDRRVELAFGGIDLHLGEEGVEAEGAPLVGHDGYDELADARVAQQVAQQPGEGHRRRDGLAARTELELGEGGRQRLGQPREPAPAHHPVRQVPAEGAASRDEVLVHRRSLRRAVVGRLLGVEGLVGDLVLQAQPGAQHPELLLGHLLDLVRGVARLDLGPERPSLDGLREDGGRRADLLGGGLVGGVELAVVVPAAWQRLQLGVGKVLDELAKARVRAEEVLADVGARLGRELSGNPRRGSCSSC